MELKLNYEQYDLLEMLDAHPAIIAEERRWNIRTQLEDMGLLTYELRQVYGFLWRFWMPTTQGKQALSLTIKPQKKLGGLRTGLYDEELPQPKSRGLHIE